jgi:hypothetical protein
MTSDDNWLWRVIVCADCQWSITFKLLPTTTG